MENTRRLVALDGGSDLLPVLRRLARQEPGSSEIAVVTHRGLRLPPALARRVRTVRERTPDTAARRAESMAAEGYELVTTTHRREPGRVSISACLIVKDEERSLEACLKAVRPFVDEVVVYDTGSTDASMAIARQAGATVVEGYWNDHFGDARNRAMAHCSSDWILFVDADEVATGKPADLRRRLKAETNDIVPVTIVSTTWEGGTAGDEVVVRRVVRRGRARWIGQLHEHLVPEAGVTDLTATHDVAPVRFLHSGYQNTVVAEKDKTTRNVDLARAEMEALSPDDPQHVVAASNYGRSLLAAGRVDDAISVLEEVRTECEHATVVLSSARSVMNVLLRAERFDEADAWLSTMAEHGESRGNLCSWRARRALAAGDTHAAEDALAQAPEGADAEKDRDCWGTPFDPESLTSLHVAVDMALGRPDAALDRLLGQVERAPDQVDVARLFEVIDQSGTAWDRVVLQVNEHFLDRSVRAVMMLAGAQALELSLQWCGAFARAHPGDHRPIVAGCMLAARADLTAALTWSVRARESGQPQLCPVRAGAENVGRPVYERALWWALLADSFGELDARTRFAETLAEVSFVDLPGLRASLDYLAPALATTAGDA